MCLDAAMQGGCEAQAGIEQGNSLAFTISGFLIPETTVDRNLHIHSHFGP
jgi:hypothetical protein